MEDFEKLGVFYLGCEYDVSTKSRKPDLVLYDSKDLLTHAVCVGMTGSGKTGLCICLLEEAAIDGIPSIVIDPKGDLTNLMLTFPELKKEEFLPWINEEDARNHSVSSEEYAAQQAELWKKGLAEWGQDAGRIRRLKDAAEFIVYTPASTAGRPVSILKSFVAPDSRIRDDRELLQERISTTATTLLSLIGMQAAPTQSREHILISTILDVAWREGRDLDLARIIQEIQTPPVTRIGVFDLESFFPAKDRFAFAMSINNLLAAPGFDLWLQGEPLDIQKLLYTDQGKPRVSIFSIAHLNDTERMFFVSLLLTQMVGWTRTQSGTSSLRCLLYMDEIFGYFPPVANPPSKQPLLTLLKQARAFGVGIVLATQNPVDLDYKGLANTGTWFIGRLQTERDKERLIEGLEWITSAAARFDRKTLEATLASLSTRIFLMNNVHEEEQVIFESRWALSYLRGPLTRDQIRALSQAEPLLPSSSKSRADASASMESVPVTTERPALPPEIPQFFLSAQNPDNEIVYQPKLLGIARIYYADAKMGIALDQPASYLADFSSPWQNAAQTNLQQTDLDKTPLADARFAELPSEAAVAKSYVVWTRAFADWILRSHKLQLWKSNLFQQYSFPNETEVDFRIRLQQKAREQRDQMIERLRQKYAEKISGLQDRIRRAEQAVGREKEQANHQKLQTAISFGTTVLGALFGRKRLGTSTLGRATTAARGVGRSMKETQDIQRAEENVTALQQRLAALEADLKSETEGITSNLDPQKETLQQIEITPKKSNIRIELVALLWIPKSS